MPQAGCTSETSPSWNPPHVNQLQNLIVSLWLASGTSSTYCNADFEITDFKRGLEPAQALCTSAVHPQHSADVESEHLAVSEDPTWWNPLTALGVWVKKPKIRDNSEIRIWTALRYLLKQGGGLRSAIWQLLLHITVGASTGDPPGQEFSMVAVLFPLPQMKLRDLD